MEGWRGRGFFEGKGCVGGEGCGPVKVSSGANQLREVMDQPSIELLVRAACDSGSGSESPTHAAAMPRGGTWLFGGLGSRGLIHHALLGSQVARAILSGDETHIAEHARRLDFSRAVGSRDGLDLEAASGPSSS